MVVPSGISGFQDGPQGARVTRGRRCAGPGNTSFSPFEARLPPGEALLRFSYGEVTTPASRSGHAGDPGTCQPSFTAGEAVSASSAWPPAGGCRCP